METTKSFTVHFRPEALKQIKALPHSEAKRVMAAIDSLAQEPRPLGKSRRLQAYDGLYRLRVGNYRVVYRLPDDKHEIWVTRVGHRKDVYR